MKNIDKISDKLKKIDVNSLFFLLALLVKTDICKYNNTYVE